MIEMMMNLASDTSTAWWILAGAAVVIAVEATRSASTTLWGDLMDEDD